MCLIPWCICHWPYLDPSVDANELAELTTRYTEHAVNFIERNKTRPFFLYVPHTMVHMPLAVSRSVGGCQRAGGADDAIYRACRQFHRAEQNAAILSLCASYHGAYAIGRI